MEAYVGILETDALVKMFFFTATQWIFCRTGSHVQKFGSVNVPCMIDCPVCSPYVSPIGNVFDTTTKMTNITCKNKKSRGFKIQLQPEQILVEKRKKKTAIDHSLMSFNYSGLHSFTVAPMSTVSLHGQLK